MAVGFLAGCASGEKKSESGGLDKAATETAAVVGVAYNGYAGSAGISIGGGTLITSHSQGNYQFDISYSVAPLKGTYTHTYLAVEENKLVVEIPTFDELKADNQEGTYAAYKLSGSFKYAKYLGTDEDKDSAKVGQEVLKHDWNIRINAEKVKPILEEISVARQKQKNETVVTKGYVTAFMNNVDGDEFKNGVWIADGNDGMMLYGGNLASVMGVIDIGDLILMAGTASPYNGLFEVNPKSITKLEAADNKIGNHVVVEPAWKQMNEDEVKALAAVNANDPMLLPDVTISTNVDELKDDGAIELSGKIGNTDITMYVNKHTNKAQRTALIAHLKANKGKTCTLKSIGGWNSDKFQFTIAQLVKDGNLNDCFIFAA